MDSRLQLQFEDIRIHVPWGYIEGRWYGNRQVRPILAIHGWQDNLGTWDRLIPLISRHIGILCIDLPGHGRSSGYPPGITYHFMDYVNIITRVIKEYNWSKVSLMGHSMGATVIFNYAAFQPHMVDFIIQIDMIKSKYEKLDYEISYMKTRVEKLIIENERMEQTHMSEPPLYFYHEMEEALYRGSSKSVVKEACKHLLNRAISQSRYYPQKYYFSRDPRIKYYVDCPSEHGLALEMAKRIRNVPYLLVKSAEHSYMSPEDEEIVDVLKANNSKFEYYAVKGTHHLHLNNPEEVARILNPFILRHRPMILDSWSISDCDGCTSNTEIRSKL